MLEAYKGGYVVASRVLLKFTDRPPTQAELAEITKMADASYLRPLGGFGWYRLDSRSKSAAALLALLASEPLIAKVEPDSILRAAVPSLNLAGLRSHRRPIMATAPDDPDFPSQWGLSNTGQTLGGVAGTPGADIGAAEAWDHGTGSSAIVVAVLDSGIDYAHPDLAANMWSAPSAYTITEGGNVYNCPAGSHGFNAVDNLSGCSGQETDGLGHGTLAAGIIGSVGNNGVNVSGVNWTTSMISLVAFPPDENVESSEVITAIDAGLQIMHTFWNQANIRVMNMSFVTQQNDGGNQALMDEMSGAGMSGVLFTVAAGNYCQPSDYPPASFNLYNEIAVGASDQLDERAYWGSQCSDGGGQLAAPGKNNLSTAKGGGEGWFAGTSAAAPFVAGAAALLMSACPLPNSAVISTLEGTAVDVPALAAIAPNGARLSVGNAVASCTSGTPGTGSVYVDLEDQGSGEFPSTGTITVTVALNSYNVNYYTDTDTTDSIGLRLARELNTSPYISATYVGDGEIDITTTALGPYTGYAIRAGVTDNCHRFCDPEPDVEAPDLTAGGN